jgi:ketosteroid isomerase-like protein
MGETQRSNLEAAAAFYAGGPAASDEERRGFFASGFVWHVPGDTDLSGDYSGDAYFTDMPARMQPLDELEFHIESLAANQDLVVSVARIQGRRLGRTLDTTGGHVLRFDSHARIIEAWGWCADQSDLDAFFA